MDIVKRFINYTKFETTSDDFSGKRPSSQNEENLLNEIEKELNDLGLDTIHKDGFVYSYIKSNRDAKDTLFLMSHVDTSPDASGKDPNAKVINYNGGVITLDSGRTIDPKDFPNLLKHKSHELIVTDGLHLLGADDKAGCAIIMDFIERCVKNELDYPNVFVCFNADEEIGEGTRDIDIDLIKNRDGKIYAYTIDGGDINEFSYETFNAASAKVEIKGVSVHPGSAKDKMINATEVFVEFQNSLPKCRPENTCDREGFIHCTGSTTETGKAIAYYILRSFDKVELESFKKVFIENAAKLNSKYNKNIINVEIKDSYSNMFEVLKDNMDIINLVHEAYKDNNTVVNDSPIRGGTDGSALSFMGVPCPNLATGGDNFHGEYEYLDVDDMKFMVKIVASIASKIK